MEKISENIAEKQVNVHEGHRGGGGGDVDMENGHEWTFQKTKPSHKRRRRSTGGASAHFSNDSPQFRTKVSKSEFKNLSTDDKLVTLFEMLDCTNNLSARVYNIEGQLESVCSDNKYLHHRMRTLEYRSIDAEARSRRNNVIFRGIPEKYVSENCDALVRRFIQNELVIDPSDICIQRAHRLGALRRGKTRPIIVCFRDSPDVEKILQSAHKLQGKPDLGINRDYPNEIIEARSRIWSDYKTAKTKNPPKSVYIGYPAKLIVNKTIVRDEFPDWQAVLKESRHGPQTLPKSTDEPHASNVGNVSPQTVPQSQQHINPPQTRNRFDALTELTMESSTGDSDSSSDSHIDHYSQVMMGYQANVNKQTNYVTSLQVTPTHNTTHNTAVDLSVPNTT